MLRGEVDEAIKNAAILNEVFGDRLYFEVMPHGVNRNYARKEVIKVSDNRGNEFSFLPTDTVETPSGRMSIVEAMNLKVDEIWDPIPNRFQERIIQSPDQEIERFIDTAGLIDLNNREDEAESICLSEIKQIRKMYKPEEVDESK